MKYSELCKLSDSIRRSVSRKYGFRQCDYINWMIKDGYFFCLYHLDFTSVQLDVKPMYADDLWWDIFNIPENKKSPKSLRGTGAFSIDGIRIKEYILTDTDTKQISEEELQEDWQNLFPAALQDIDAFLRNNPNADTYIPNKKEDKSHDKLLYFITLLHNSRTKEMISAIQKLKTKGHNCTFSDYTSGMDSYDYILEWCKNQNH